MSITTQPRGKDGRVLGSTPIKPIVEALNSALIAIRANHPDVPNVVLVVGQSSSTKYGHFDPEKWTTENATNEIMISGESLSRGAVDTMGTLLHECAHAMAHTRGIKDTSRQGRYHNVAWSKLAIEIGLQPIKDKRIGFMTGGMPEATQKQYAREISQLKKALAGYRRPVFSMKPKPTFIKLECECRSVKVGPKFNEIGPIKCMNCKKIMKEKEMEDDEE